MSKTFYVMSNKNQMGVPEFFELWRAFSAVIVRRPS